MTGAFQVQCYTRLSPARVGWRLLSGNNRVIGVGRSTFATEAQCRAAVAVLQRDVATAAGRVRRVVGNRWMWELDLDASGVAMSGHSFDRMIRCEQSLAIFRSAIGTAVVRADLIDSGARRWHTAGRTRELA